MQLEKSRIDHDVRAEVYMGTWSQNPMSVVRPDRVSARGRFYSRPLHPPSPTSLQLLRVRNRYAPGVSLLSNYTYLLWSLYIPADLMIVKYKRDYHQRQDQEH